MPLRRGDLRYLDGLPLAIELAARASGLRPQNLCAPAIRSKAGTPAARLPHGTRCRPARWIYDRLDEDEKLLFARQACSPNGAPTWTQASWRQPEHRLARPEYAVARAARRTFPTGETRVVQLETMRNTLAQLEHAANASRGRRMRYSCFACACAGTARRGPARSWRSFDAARQPAASWRGPGTGEAGEDFASSRRAIFWDFRGISARGANSQSPEMISGHPASKAMPRAVRRRDLATTSRITRQRKDRSERWRLCEMATHKTANLVGLATQPPKSRLRAALGSFRKLPIMRAARLVGSARALTMGWAPAPGEYPGQGMARTRRSRCRAAYVERHRLACRACEAQPAGDSRQAVPAATKPHDSPRVGSPWGCCRLVGILGWGAVRTTSAAAAARGKPGIRSNRERGGVGAWKVREIARTGPRRAGVGVWRARHSRPAFVIDPPIKRPARASGAQRKLPPTSTRRLGRSCHDPEQIPTTLPPPTHRRLSAAGPRASLLTQRFSRCGAY